MTSLYCLSGLGVDEAAFRSFAPSGLKIVHIPWLTPEKNETLRDYSRRLFESANLPTDYLLLGVSFGGMIAQEFAKIRTPKSLYLISTISSVKELPWIYKFFGKCGLHQIIPSSFLKTSTPLTYFLFGARKREDKILLKHILKQTDGYFLKWAMNAILHWQTTVEPKGLKIHGDKDRILPVQGKVDHLISNAGHFMIVTHGAKISGIIENHARSIQLE